MSGFLKRLADMIGVVALNVLHFAPIWGCSPDRTFIASSCTYRSSVLRKSDSLSSTLTT